MKMYKLYIIIKDTDIPIGTFFARGTLNRIQDTWTDLGYETRIETLKLPQPLSYLQKHSRKSRRAGPVKHIDIGPKRNPMEKRHNYRSLVSWREAAHNAGYRIEHDRSEQAFYAYDADNLRQGWFSKETNTGTVYVSPGNGTKRIMPDGKKTKKYLQEYGSNPLRAAPVGPNQTEIQTGDGGVVLFSYETPVAAFKKGGRGGYKTDKKFSKTTTQHIAAFAKRHGLGDLVTMPQKFFDGLQITL